MKNIFYINPDITKAETLPASFYKDPTVFDDIKEKVFLRTWQWLGDEDVVEALKAQTGFEDLALGTFAAIDEKTVLIVLDNLG